MSVKTPQKPNVSSTITLARDVRDDVQLGSRPVRDDELREKLRKLCWYSAVFNDRATRGLSDNVVCSIDAAQMIRNSRLAVLNLSEECHEITSKYLYRGTKTLPKVAPSMDCIQVTMKWRTIRGFKHEEVLTLCSGEARSDIDTETGGLVDIVLNDHPYSLIMDSVTTSLHSEDRTKVREVEDLDPNDWEVKNVLSSLVYTNNYASLTGYLVHTGNERKQPIGYNGPAIVGIGEVKTNESVVRLTSPLSDCVRTLSRINISDRQINNIQSGMLQTNKPELDVLFSLVNGYIGIGPVYINGNFERVMMSVDNIMKYTGWELSHIQIFDKYGEVGVRDVFISLVGYLGVDMLRRWYNLLVAVEYNGFWYAFDDIEESVYGGLLEGYNFHKIEEIMSDKFIEVSPLNELEELMFMINLTEPERHEKRFRAFLAVIGRMHLSKQKCKLSALRLSDEMQRWQLTPKGLSNRGITVHVPSKQELEKLSRTSGVPAKLCAKVGKSAFMYKHTHDHVLETGWLGNNANVLAVSIDRVSFAVGRPYGLDAVIVEMLEMIDEVHPVLVTHQRDFSLVVWHDDDTPCCAVSTPSRLSSFSEEDRFGTTRFV